VIELQNLGWGCMDSSPPLTPYMYHHTMWYC